MIDPDKLESVPANALQEGDRILVTGHKIQKWRIVTHVRHTPKGIEVSTTEFPTYPPDHQFLVDRTNETSNGPTSCTLPTTSAHQGSIPGDGDPRSE